MKKNLLPELARFRPGNRSPLACSLLTFALSIPFWIAGALTHLQFLPGIPINALGVLCMVGSDSILAYRENGFAAVKELLKRSFDFKRIRAKIWFLPIILLMPAIMILSFFVLRLMGVPVPVPQFSITTPFLLFAVFFVAAIGEELGWMGYAMAPLQDRFGALGGALLLGGVWAVWHFVPLLSVQRSLVWIVWWALGTVAMRVIIIWLYNNTVRSSRVCSWGSCGQVTISPVSSSADIAPFSGFSGMPFTR
jgi:membrane protease YdiL (CAAX protease family)